MYPLDHMNIIYPLKATPRIVKTAAFLVIYAVQLRISAVLKIMAIYPGILLG